MSEASDVNATALAQLAAVQGQLTVITQLINHHHEATNRRIDDMRGAMETRLSGVETRLGNVEKNERATAVRTAGIATGASTLVTAFVEVLRWQRGH